LSLLRVGIVLIILFYSRYLSLWDWSRTHNVDIGSTMIDVHYVVHDIHVLVVVLYEELIFIYIMVMVILVYLRHVLRTLTSTAALQYIISIIIGLVCFHIDLVA
jgi:hypothetical protein